MSEVMETNQLNYKCELTTVSVVEFVALNVNNVNSSHTALRGARKPTGVFIRIIVTEEILNHSQKYLLEE